MTFSNRLPSSSRGRRAAVLAGVTSLLAGSGGALAARPTAGSVTSERLKVPSGPNSVRGLAGEPAVDPFSASVSYRVPIELPAGRGGLTPSLALTYSGVLGNGPLGIGWSLSLARIQRATRLGRPRFDANDELEITGLASGRLVAISATEYRVEGLGQTMRVKRVGDGFEVDDGSGVRYRFGTAASGRQGPDAAHTLGWLVEEVTDTKGERIRYEYLHDQGQVYLSRVVWGPDDTYQAALTYETRADATRSYREGFAVVTAKRLARVTVTAFGTERHAYQMSYDASFPVARLAGVASTGKGGQGAWPSLSFTYAAPASPLITPVAGAGTWRLNNNGTTLVDLDGDGAAELLRLADGGHSYLSNRDGTFSGLQTLGGNSQSITSVQLQDVDGDARPELVTENNGGWLVWKFSRTQWLPQGSWPGTQGVALKQPASARFAELNGDGVVDAILWTNDHLQLRMGTRTGLAVAVTAPKIGGAVLPTADGRFHDTNGDGLDDYVVVRTDRLDLYVGRGDGSFDAAVPVAYPMTATWEADNVELGDLDRDGLMDLLRVDLGMVRWFRGLAGGGFSTTAVVLNNPEPYASSTVVVAVADSNGNGSQDVVWSSSAGMWRMDMAGTTTAGMLARVQNGLGLDVTFDYQSSHALSVAARTAGSAWTSELPVSMPVPVQKRTALGPGETTRQVRYSVRDGFWDAVEQRFGGFLTTTVTTAGATPAETGSVTTRHLSGTGINRNLRGKPQTEQVRDGTGARLSLTTYTWQTMAVAGLPDVPLLRAAVMTEKKVRYEDTTPVREATSTYEHDAHGRTVRTVEHGRLDLTGDESVRETRYADDDSTWVRNLVCEEKVTELSGALVTQTQTLFGDAGAVEALGVAGKGWPRLTRAWLADASRFVEVSQTGYDAHGNPVRVVAGGIEVRLGYDPTGLFAVEERHVAAGSADLVWRAAWDQVLGVATTITDPNGHQTHARHDALGRFTGSAVDGKPDHQVIEYDWTPPFPRTTVWAFDGADADLGPKPTTWSTASQWRQTVAVSNGLGEVRYQAQRLAPAQWIISDYQERDPNSRVVFAGRPVYAAALEHSIRPAGIVGDQLAYDPLGRLIRQTLPTGASRTISHSSFVRTTQEADLAPVRSEIDGQGRAITTERSLADGTHEVVQATYDAAGRLTEMSLASGAVQRAFAYDSLGRLTDTYDPDLGARTLTWNDGGRLLSESNAAGQIVTYTYDGFGRLLSHDGGSLYTYHYDTARPGAGPLSTNLAGRLAWIEEPSGGLDAGYDDRGRLTFGRRRIGSEVSELKTVFAPSGLVQSLDYDDGFNLSYRYDPAGRLVAISDLWELLEQDASGGPLRERTRNGVETRYTRDPLGLASRVSVRNPSGAAIYDVTATRNAWNAVTGVTDLDGVGLDHSAQFGYDAFARLTSASVGSGAGAYHFAYSYDVLHNMMTRTAAGPTALGGFFGTHHYGEGGQAPRQLTSISDGAGTTLHSFAYDDAGRQIAQDDLVMTYDGADRLLRVDGLPGGSVTHAYGHDGQRVKTTSPDGAPAYFFGDGTAVRNGVREHDVTAGDRVIARVELLPGTAGVDGSAAPALGRDGPAAGWRLALALLALIGLGVTWARRKMSRRMELGKKAISLLAIVMVTACAGTAVDSTRQSVHVQRASFHHAGFGAGPVVFTDEAGAVVEERRIEPFGAPIGPHAVAARDLNPLNQRTEAATGWSDHGARWMAPETARWLTVDPPVAGPDPALMDEPWKLHPYQYVGQNPVAYWDPDGRDRFPVTPGPPVWSPPPRPPVATPAPAPAARPGVAPTASTGASRLMKVGGGLLVGATILLTPTPLSDGTCRAPGSCGQPAPPKDDEEDRRRRSFVRGYHGTNGDNILAIMNSHVLRPEGGEIFLSATADVYVHGADVNRRAAFSIYVTVYVGNATVIRTSKPGNPQTILIHTAVPLPVVVESLQIRTRNEDGLFTYTEVHGEDAIRRRLAQ